VVLISRGAVAGSSRGDYDIQVHKDIGKIEVTYNGEGFGVLVLDFEDFRNTYVIESGSTELIDFAYGNGEYIVRTAKHLGDGELEELSSFNLEVRVSEPTKIHTGRGYYSSMVSLGVSWETVEDVFSHIVGNYEYDKSLDVAELTYYKPNMEEFMSSRLGICVDYASLMGAVLRGRGYSVRFPVGNVSNGEYHMWVEVYDKERDEWVGYDPTYGIKEDIPWEVTGYY